MIWRGTLALRRVRQRMVMVAIVSRIPSAPSRLDRFLRRLRQDGRHMQTVARAGSVIVSIRVQHRRGTVQQRGRTGHSSWRHLAQTKPQPPKQNRRPLPGEHLEHRRNLPIAKPANQGVPDQLFASHVRGRGVAESVDSDGVV